MRVTITSRQQNKIKVIRSLGAMQWKEGRDHRRIQSVAKIKVREADRQTQRKHKETNLIWGVNYSC
jgi:hypothetical protein